MTVRVKRLGRWETADRAAVFGELPVEESGDTMASSWLPGDEVLAVDPQDQRERRWLAGAAASGAAVNMGDVSATLLSELREVQPTVFRASPAVWQQLRTEVERRADDSSRLKRLAYERRWFVRRAIRRWLGLERVRRAETTGPLDESLLEWFRQLDIEVETVG